MQLRNIVTHAAGNLTPQAKEFIPRSEWTKVIGLSRAYVAVFVAVIAACAVTASALPALFVVLPRFYGSFMAQLFNLTQHAGLEENVRDHRLNTRTVILNPMVPFHALPRVHALIADQCPPPHRGLIEAYREIVPALLRQRRDPTHHAPRLLPAQVVPA